MRHAKLVSGQLAVAKDFVKQAGADGFARVHRYNRAPAIFVTLKVMAALNAKNTKAHPFQSPN
jgi:hypothetical protein